ncbi:AP2 domain-containing protein, partial [Dysosmobacter welbionis]
KQQSYTKADGLLTLEKEGAATQTFEFAGITGAAGVRVEFSDLILTDSSVELDHISIGGHTAVFDSSTNTYTVDAVGLTNSILEIAPKDPQNATIKLDGQDYDVDASHATQLASGTTTWNITVSNGGNSASYTLKLTNNADFVSVTGVSLNKTSLTLTEGSTSQLTATVEPNNATNRNVTWSSSNSKVATVDGNGKVTAHKA